MVVVIVVAVALDLTGNLETFPKGLAGMVPTWIVAFGLFWLHRTVNAVTRSVRAS